MIMQAIPPLANPGIQVGADLSSSTTLALKVFAAEPVGLPAPNDT